MNTEYTVKNTSEMIWVKRISPSKGFVTYNKELYRDPETALWIKLSKRHVGTVTPLHWHNCGHCMYVLSGTLQTHEGTYGPGSFVWFPEGNVSEHGGAGEDDLIVMYVADKPFDITYVETANGRNSDVIYKDASKMRWIQHTDASDQLITYDKKLYYGNKTGVLIRLIKYPAGTIMPMHSHNFAHGMYVLQGICHTHQGNYGPGTFIWFPKGNEAEYGAAADDDLIVMDISEHPCNSALTS